MSNRRFLKRILAAALVLVLGLSMSVGATSAQGETKDNTTSTSGSDEKEETKDKAENTSLSDAKEEMKELKDQLKKAEGIVKDLKDSKGSVEKKLSQLNKSMIEISAQITELENQLIAKNEQIILTQQELVLANAVADKQYEDMKIRIQYMYENAQTSYLEAFFASEDIADFLNSADYINQIQDYDRQKLEDYKATILEIEEIEATLEQERATLETMKAEVEQEKKNVAAVMAKRENELADIKANLNEALDEAEIIAAEVQAQEELIAEIIRLEAEKVASDSAYTGAFTWPVPSSKRVTSDYGPRKSPTAGASSNHKGIDIGAPTGDNIVAAAPGKVTVSRYSSSAGYYITIDHGGGLYTVYMHCSKLLANVGDQVAAGDVIAKVGSTGISTGPHLHFGVSLNGAYVSPWGYLVRP